MGPAHGLAETVRRENRTDSPHGGVGVSRGEWTSQRNRFGTGLADPGTAAGSGNNNRPRWGGHRGSHACDAARDGRRAATDRDDAPVLRAGRAATGELRGGRTRAKRHPATGNSSGISHAQQSKLTVSAVNASESPDDWRSGWLRTECGGANTAWGFPHERQRRLAASEHGSTAPHHWPAAQHHRPTASHLRATVHHHGPAISHYRPTAPVNQHQHAQGAPSDPAGTSTTTARHPRRLPCSARPR
jgi:hypothetical protein